MKDEFLQLCLLRGCDNVLPSRACCISQMSKKHWWNDNWQAITEVNLPS